MGVVRCVGAGVVRIWAFYIFATGILTYMYGGMYGHSTFPFLSDIPYLI